MTRSEAASREEDMPAHKPAVEDGNAYAQSLVTRIVLQSNFKRSCTFASLTDSLAAGVRDPQMFHEHESPNPRQ